MSVDLLAALAVYAFVTSITPGPNNTMLLVSGANFGLRRTIPHIVGINLGFAFMVAAVGLGIGGVVLASPLLYKLLRYGGAAYLLYLAWKIARFGGVTTGDVPRRPFTFLQAAAFQWINPKAWILAIGAIAGYTVEARFAASIVAVVAVFTIVNGPCLLAWATFGTALRGLLASPRTLRIFNVAMALLLAASVYPILANG